METALSRYLRSLSDPDIPVSISDVEALLREYPFFTLPAVTLLRREGDALPAETRRTLMESLALNAPEPDTLVKLTDRDSETWLNFYPPEEKNAPGTLDAISTFLATYGKTDEKEEALLEKLIFNPPADYSAILEREERETATAQPASHREDGQDAIISNFLSKTAETAEKPDTSAPAREETASPAEPIAAPAAGPSPATKPAERFAEKPEEKPAEKTTDKPEDHPVAIGKAAADDSSLSESLAKIYIKRGRYDKAFEIISNLSLKNPKKSVYFADQLRFLQKLMLNSRYKK